MPRDPYRFNLPDFRRAAEIAFRRPPAVQNQAMRQQQVQAQVQGYYQQVPIPEPDAIFRWDGPPIEMKPKQKKPAEPAKPLPRALPQGRMKNVKLGDIIKAYDRGKVSRDHFAIIDFRLVKIGDYFLDSTFNVQRANVGLPPKHKEKPRIILGYIKAEVPPEDVIYP